MPTPTSLPENYHNRRFGRRFALALFGLLGSCAMSATLSIGILAGYSRMPFINEFPVNMLQLLCLFPILVIGVGLAFVLTRSIRYWCDVRGGVDTGKRPWVQFLYWVFVIGFVAIVVLGFKDVPAGWTGGAIGMVVGLGAWSGGLLGALHPASLIRSTRAHIFWIAAMALTWAIAWASIFLIFLRYPSLF